MKKKNDKSRSAHPASARSFDKASKRPTQDKLRSQGKRRQGIRKPHSPFPVLSKYLAMCGVSARRKAADLIAAGRVTVNGTMSDEPGYRVQPTDKIAVDGKSVRPVSKIYLMMNKPKDTITTMSDERDRNTVIDVLRGEVPERVFAVGRLDRNTTGLLLMTNDGDLAVKLSHPSTEVSKVYRATLDKPFPKIDLAALRGGVELHDGFLKPDEVEVIPGTKRCEVLVVIHSGRYHIVRRLFRYLQYKVTALERVQVGPLTLDDLPRGHWRYLTEDEVEMLRASVRD